MALGPPPAQKAGQKRKADNSVDNRGAKQARFRNIRNARAIGRQTTDAALSNGELNVDKFVRAREYEIKALEAGLRSSKDALSTRAFQEVPRDLRRRTASHNVRRVPKRLRRRAAKEMREDNTPTVQSRRRKPTPHQRLRLETAKRLQILNDKSRRRRAEKAKQVKETAVSIDPVPKVPTTEPSSKTKVKIKKPKAKLRAPPVPRAKYRKRQISKSWLPTHLFHAKRARMTPPKEALWRFSIPLSPNNKVYRTTHRASTLRSAVAWDTSYMSTIGLRGPERSILGLLAGIGMTLEAEKGAAWSAQYQKWIKGARTRTAWVFERDVSPPQAIAPVTVIWNPQEALVDQEMPNADEVLNRKAKVKDQRQIFIRVHPAAFMEIWEQVTRLAKVQKPSVSVEDLRFDIGSIEITGPNATEALAGTLWAVGEQEDNAAPRIWSMLRSLPNPSAVPANAVLAFEAADPRLRFPPQKLNTNSSAVDMQAALQMLANWPLDRQSSLASLFDRGNRLEAQRSMPSQRIINKRKTTATPGSLPESRPTDPQIPIILMNSRLTINNQSTWTLMLPWKCVDTIWRSLVYQPLSCGGQVRFGGLDEKRQVSFESGAPWFPGDFPGAKAGDFWEAQQRDKREAEWKARPKGRRLEYPHIDLGLGRVGEIGEGWSCDWERLISPQVKKTDEGSTIGRETAEEISAVPADAVTDETLPKRAIHHVVRHIPREQAMSLLSKPSHTTEGSLTSSVATIKITMVSRGIPQVCARIYRLPTTNTDLRARWTALLDATGTPSTRKAAATRKPPPRDTDAATYRAWVAASLLEEEMTKPGSEKYPPVPDEEDLIGFVTTGNFNLSEGLGTAIGSLLLSRVISPSGVDAGQGKIAGQKSRLDRICIVRDAGQTIGRLARWELV